MIRFIEFQTRAEFKRDVKPEGWFPSATGEDTRRASSVLLVKSLSYTHMIHVLFSVSISILKAEIYLFVHSQVRAQIRVLNVREMPGSPPLLGPSFLV